MPRCPNCGRMTVRTADWACQWCGYPLLSPSYKKIPQTYKQLKEEKLREQKPPVSEEAEVAEREAEPMSEPEAEVVAEREPEPVPEPEAEVAEREPEPVPEPKAEVAEREPEPVPEPKAEVVEREPEPIPAPAAMEITAEELLSAYGADEAAAHERFTGKVLKVTGVVNKIVVNDMNENYYITLSDPGKNKARDIQCKFQKKYVPEINRLTVGQTVAVQGKYSGYVISIVMRDCVLVG